MFFGNLDGFRFLNRLNCLTILEWHEILSHTRWHQGHNNVHHCTERFAQTFPRVIIMNKTTSSDIKARFAKIMFR